MDPVVLLILIFGSVLVILLSYMIFLLTSQNSALQALLSQRVSTEAMAVEKLTARVTKMEAERTES